MNKLFRSAAFLSLALLPLCAMGQDPLISKERMPNAVYFPQDETAEYTEYEYEIERRVFEPSF